jgi:hypothetical protein
MLTLTAIFMRYGAQGNHRRTVSPHRVVFADATRQRDARQSARAHRHLVRRRAGLHMARATQAIRPLAHDLYAHESVVEARGAGSRLCPVATHADPPREDRGRGLGTHHRHGPSRRHGGGKNNGPHAMGQARGGGTTKSHRVAAEARTALAFFALSPGQAHDAPAGRTLRHRVGRMPRPVPRLMERAYAGDATRQRARQARTGWFLLSL